MINSINSENQDSRINVVLVVRDADGTYARHAAVVMASIFANTESRVRVYIVHDDTLSAANAEKLQGTADGFGQELRLINAEEAISGKSLDTGNLALGGQRGKLFKLLIPELLDVSKVIYLDCDIVVNLDLLELWTADIGDKSIGAANDVWLLGGGREECRSWRRDFMLKVMGIVEKNYFNSGVLVMDLDKIRSRCDLMEKAAEFYKKFKKCTTFTDQDCLNYVFTRDVSIIDEKFNRLAFARVDKNDQSTLRCIMHMAGEKPWDAYTRPGIDEFYWHYLALTPWCAEGDGLISAILMGWQSSGLQHRHSSDCVRRLKKQLADNIFQAHVWKAAHLLIAFLRYGTRDKH